VRTRETPGKGKEFERRVISSNNKIPKYWGFYYSLGT
jgi:hypothetical protein